MVEPFLLLLLFVLLLIAAPISPVGAQEAPSILIPSLSNNTSLRARQDVCDRFDAYDRGEVELRLALRGLALRPLFTVDSFFYLDENGELDQNYAGMVPAIMDELAVRGGFTWRDSFGITTGPPSNKTWTDLLLWGIDYFDVYCDWWSRQISRLKLGVTFPQGYYDGSLILVGLEEGESDSHIDLWQWLEPFDPEVWYVIAVTIVISGVVYQILDYVPPNHTSRYHTPIFNDYRQQSFRHREQRRRFLSRASFVAEKEEESAPDGAHTIGDGIFLSTLLFTTHYQFLPRTAPSRLFSASMAFWALLISSNYTANLASFFVIENTPKVAIQSIEDAIQTGQGICVWDGTSGHSWMLKEYPKAKVVPVKSVDEVELYEAIRNGECAAGLSTVYSFQRLEMLKEANPDCNLRWVGRILKHVPAGFAVKADAGGLCTSLIHDVLNMHLMEMEADGFLEQVWQKELERSQTQDCGKQASVGSGDASSNSRSLREMAGTFVIHLFFGVVAIILAILSRLRHVRKECFQAEAIVEPEHSQSESEVIVDPKHNSEPDPPNSDAEGACRMAEESDADRASKTTEERLEMMEATFHRRQNELELKMNTVINLLKENNIAHSMRKEKPAGEIESEARRRHSATHAEECGW